MEALTRGSALSEWPPLLTMERAVAYTGFSAQTLKRQVLAGKLNRFGTASNKGTWVFELVELRRWMKGDPQAVATIATGTA